MRYTTKQYAEALYDILEKTDKSKHKRIIALFAKTLFKHRNVGKIKDIAYSFEDIALSKRGLTKVSVTAASKQEAENVTKNIKGNTLIETHIDPSLIAGAEITAGDTRISTSLKSRLLNLRKAIAR